ncbi:MAG: AbrB/MazE/SpoVT family DNA-binding domain-containing protein [Deltaproteobacteria bacterium]|nr:MAG: AbrB/MazE/SpoVT family DNA-binding domain-containing protein [Deltaproteobacteria bacterium]
MKTSTMTVKGQVTVPKELRDAFGWKVGDEVAFLREKDGVKIVRAERQRQGRAIVERLKGASWNRKLTTDRLMVMTRGEER